MFIIILLSTLAAFRIDNFKVGKLFFLINNLIISPLYFDIKISEVANSSMAGYFCLKIYRELRGLIIFLGYNSMAFYLDRIFSSRKLISRALV